MPHGIFLNQLIATCPFIRHPVLIFPLTMYLQILIGCYFHLNRQEISRDWYWFPKSRHFNYASILKEINASQNSISQKPSPSTTIPTSLPPAILLHYCDLHLHKLHLTIHVGLLIRHCCYFPVLPQPPRMFTTHKCLRSPHSD